MSTGFQFVQTELLDIAYEERGPKEGLPVILLHGWPDDVRTWDGVVAPLNAAGFRTIAPYLRGFGPTRFRPESTTRSGQLAALGSDLVELAAALRLSRFALVGHDWGARAAYIAATELGPEHVTHLVALSVGYGTNDPGQHLPLVQVRNYWYHAHARRLRRRPGAVPAREALNTLPKTGPCDGAQPGTRSLQSVVKPQANTSHGVRHELSF
jgi:pimeloyl-ACP methyl ester carboxylesterase